MKRNYFSKRVGILFLSILISSTFSFSQISSTQIFQEWFKTEGLTDHAYKAKSVFDNTGALYVVGGTINGNGWDWLITKYDAITNAELWTVSYDYNALNDYATNVVVDSDCNLYITGSVTNDTAMGLDLAIAKFDSSGTFQWVNTFDQGGSFPTYNDGGVSICLDGGGYVYVAGGTESSSNLKDFITIQYDCATGTEQWVQIHAKSNNDIAGNIFFDGSDIHVTGLISKNPVYKAVFSIEYDTYGNFINETPLSPFQPDSITDIRDVTVDVNGDVYVTGYFERPWAGTGKDVRVMKLDSLLDIQWTYTLPIRVDDSGYVYVGGVQGYYMDAFLIKLDQSGNQLWLDNYTPGTGYTGEAVQSIVIGSDYNPIATGYAWIDPQGNFDYYTFKADHANGDKIWDITYNGISDKDDQAWEIALDANQNIYVIGQSEDETGNTSNWVTVKYHEHEVYNIPDPDTMLTGIDLVSNYGQLINSDTTVNNDVVIYDWQLQTFYQSNRIIEVVGGADTSDITNDTLVRIDIVLHNDSSRNVFALNKQKNYFNYYTMLTPSGGLNRVPSYQKAYYPNAYKGVDIYSTKNGWGPIHQFVVRPNEAADPSDITFTIEGADTIYLNSGNLVIVHALDTIIYFAPECSQVDSSGGYVAPDTASVFTLNSGVVSFTDGAWASSNLPIIIEINQGGPFLMGGGPYGNINWSTYFGGEHADEIKDGYIAEGDNALHVCGYSSASFVPVTTGTAIQPFFMGATDAIIGKFNADGTRQFVTHFGDIGEDKANGITYGQDGKIYVVGTTSSTAMGYITPLDYEDTYQGGTSDGLIVSLFGNGTFNWATYFGGAKMDILNSITLDPSNPSKLAIVGYSKSDDFPLDSSGVSGTTYCVPCADTASTGIIVKLDTTGFPIWSTCLGGTHGYEEQELNDLEIADNGDIYITGYSASSSFPHPISQPPLAYVDSISGTGIVSRDIILAKFDSACTFIWSTYYGGSGRDEGKSITLTDGGEIFVGGLSSSADFDTESFGSAYMDYGLDQSMDVYAWDCVFLKFNSDLERDWATFFGGDNYDLVTDVNYDNGWLYATGALNSFASSIDFPASNPPGSLDYQATFAVATDGGTAMILAFNPWLGLTWATGIPGWDADEGRKVVTDDSEQLYLLTTATSTVSFPLWNDGVAYFNYHHSDSVNFAPNDIPDGAITRFDLPVITVLNIEEPVAYDNFLLYPNPTTGIVNFKVENGFNNLTVYDLMGKVVYLGTGTNETTFQSIDLSNLQSGIYIVTLTKGSNRKTGKVIVSH
jgi:hypothetical protein